MQTRQIAATRMLKVMMAAALLLPIALFSYASWVAYGNIHKEADERIERSLQVLQEQSLNIFQSAKFAIKVADQLTDGMTIEEIQKNEQSLHEKLQRLDAANKIVESIWILDESGRAIISSAVYPLRIANNNFSDRDYFSVHKDTVVGTYISKVFQPRVRLSEPVFSVSRRLQSESEKFSGVVQATISPQNFQEYFGRLSHGQDTYYALVRADGQFLARFPVQQGSLGENSKLLKSIKNTPDAGTFTVVAALDGIERRIGYHKVDGFPVYVLAGVRTSALFDQWVSTMAVHLIFGIPATALLFGITGLTLQRTRRLYEEANRRVLAEEALRQSQKMDAIGQLTGGVAHDFNNLLTIIIGNLDIAQRTFSKGGPDTLKRLETLVKSAMQGARRAAALTQRLLAFSRRQPLEPRPVKADKLVQGMSDLLRQSLGETYEIEIVNAGGLWQVEVDPVQLESAILNLALNARDAMRDGGKLTIETSNAFLDENYVRRYPDLKAGQYVQLAISDTGHGMDEETINRAFEPFFTTKAAGQGTGLGLSQVYGYTKQSGGHAKIYSEPGEGTTVKIYLPRLFAETAPLASAARELGVMGNRETILVVEDDEDVRRYVVEILRDANFTVFHAADAAAAEPIVASEAREIDIILTDVVLPGKNGRQFTDEVRAQFPDIKVLFMTGYSRNAIVHQGRLDRGVALIQKPLTQASLVAKIMEVLQNEAAQPEAGPVAGLGPSVIS